MGSDDVAGGLPGAQALGERAGVVDHDAVVKPPELIGVDAVGSLHLAVDTYLDRAALVGRLVVAVMNFALRRVAGFPSQVLALGALPIDGRPLLVVDEGALPGDPIG